MLAMCPTHAAWDQLLALESRFEERWISGVPTISLPMFPDAEGKVVSKAAVVETFRWAATLLGVPHVSSDGAERLTGHSLRHTGAQGLAKMGVDLLSIQLLGRWGGRCVEGYVRDTMHSIAAARARSAAMSASLRTLVTAASQAAVACGGAPAHPDADLEAAIRRIFASLGPSDRPSLAEELKEVVSCSTRRSQGQSSSDLPGSSQSSPASPSPPLRLGQAPTVSPLSRDEGRAPADAVLNRASGYTHRVVCGPPVLQSDRWISGCGWKFGRSDHAELTAPVGKLCSKCYPHQ